MGRPLVVRQAEARQWWPPGTCQNYRQGGQSWSDGRLCWQFTLSTPQAMCHLSKPSSSRSGQSNLVKAVVVWPSGNLGLRCCRDYGQVSLECEPPPPSPPPGESDVSAALQTGHSWPSGGAMGCPGESSLLILGAEL